MKKKFFFVGIFLLLFSCDFFLKYWTYTCIPKMSWLYPFYPYGGVGIFRNLFGVSFSLNHVENLGAAWGLFSAYPQHLFYLRIAIVIGLAVYLILCRCRSNKVGPLFLIITGAVGNILDSFLYGHVIDMFHVKFGSYSFPVFNFADTMITIGIVWLFFLSFVNKTEKSSHKETKCLKS